MKLKLLFAFLLFVLGLGGLAACSSLAKDEVARALAQIPKNAEVVARGLQTLQAEITLGGETQPGEFTFLHVDEAQGTERPTLVFVHGTPGTLFTWSRVLFGAGDEPGLAADHEVYALEMIGHGLATDEASSYGFQVCADYLSSFLDALDLTDVVLVANSYGGEFAWRAALDRPNRVAGLVLMSASGYERADDEWLPEEETMRDLPGAKFGWIFNSRKRIEPALALHYHRPVTDELEEMYFVCENSENWRAMVELARDENGDRAAELPELGQPTLLLWGADDKAYSVERFARRFEADLPDATLVEIPGAGHYPQEEFPEPTIRAIRVFVQERMLSTVEAR